MTKRRKIKRKVMAWLLAVVMVFTVTPSTVFAAEGNETEEHTHGTPWDTTDALPIKSGTYYLTADISLSSTCEIKSGTVNLCLNGHVIEGNCSNSMIKISSDATLNIYDCQTTEHKFTSSTTAAWNLNESTGNRVIHGGVITGGNCEYGSVICNYGTFNMYDGNIVGNTSNQKNTGDESGGIICNYFFGTVTLYNDVNIMGNYGAGHGATIFNNGTFYNYGNITENVAVSSSVRNCSGTFYNGTADNHGDAMINQNVASSTTDQTSAGGVANYSRTCEFPAKFYNYGQINENKSQRSSGGVLNKGAEFTNYGTINNNVANRHCGGVDNTSSDSIGTDYLGNFFKNYGEINGNIANGTQNSGNGSGGGIYNEGKAAFYNYGSICNNKARTSGGGFYISNNTCSLVVGRDSVITGNEVGTFTNNQIQNPTISNICLNQTGSSKIMFDTTGKNKLTDTAKMGVHITAQRTSVGTVTKGYSDKNAYSGTGAGKYFFADNSDKQIVILKDDEIYLENHTHIWNYVADGQVIEAYCSSSDNLECPYKQTPDTHTNALKVTLNASNETYSGNPYQGAGFDATQLSYFNSVTCGKISDSDIVYYTDEALTAKTDTEKCAAASEGSAPKNVGTYYATVAVTDTNNSTYTAKHNFTISPKSIQSTDITVEIGPDGGLEYNGDSQTPDITVKDGDTALTAGTDYTLSGETSATDIGEHSISIEGKGNYEGTRTESWKITKYRMNGVSKNNYSGMYDGLSHSASVTVTKPSDAKITYCQTETGNYVNECPAYKDAGEHTVYYKIEHDEYETETGTLTVNITPKTITVKAKDASKKYRDIDPAFSYEVDSSTPLISNDTLSGITVTRSAGEDVGTYTMTATQISGANPNYNITFNTGTFTINKGTYGETLTKTIYLDAADENVTNQTFAVSDFFGETVPTDAKITTVSATDANEDVVTNVQADTINNVVKYDTASKDKEKDATNTYTVTISSKNYTDISATLRFVVATKEVVTLSGLKVDDKTYDKAAVSPLGTVVAKKTSDTSVTDIPVSDYVYTWEENKGTVESPNWQTLSKAPTNAGNYRLTVSVALTNATYIGSSEPYEFTIAKKKVMVAPLNQSIYAKKDSNNDYMGIDTAAVTYKGFIGTDNDSDAAIQTKATVACNVTDYTIAGTYKDSLTISNVGTLKEEMAKNYELERKGTGTLSIVSTTSTADEKQQITLGRGGVVTTDTIKEENLPKTRISNLSVDLAKALLESDEVIDVIGGKNALIYLDLIDAEEEVTEEDKTKISGAASSGFKVTDTYLDLSLYKKVGTASAKKLTDLKGNKIAVEIVLPTEMRPASSVNRSFKVIRMHGGEAVELQATYDKTKNTLTFETDKFSVYAIAYKDTQNSSGGGSSYYPVTGITLSKENATLTKKGETVQLTAEISPSYATNKNITWTSDNEAVATVDSTGKVTAVGNGTAKITATTQNGNKTATIVITVDVTPEESAKPVVPSETDKPSVTSTPQPTATTAPATPEVTNTPVVSATPEVTEAPKATEAPQETEAPKPTETPEITQTPDVTVAPTEQPVTTPKPTAKPKKVTAGFGALKSKSVKQTNTTVSLSWTKVSDADGYLVYGSRCNHDGEKYTKKLLTTIKGNKNVSWTQKSLKKATYYKYQIKAYKMVDGKKVIIAKSVDVHAVTKGGKHCVASSVKVTKIAGKTVSSTAKSLKLSLKKGKTAKIQAVETPSDKNKTICSHRAISYETSNSKVATVTSNGKIKAVGKGTCSIWVYAQNGVYKTITITVK